MIVGISGKKGAGKNTLAHMIQWCFACERDVSFGFNRDRDDFPKTDAEKRSYKLISGWEIKSFASKLKQVAGIILGYPDFEYRWENDPNFRHKLVPKPLRKKVFSLDLSEVRSHRDFLQYLGTNVMRKAWDNIWVHALLADYDGMDWIVTDVRFPNEVMAIKDLQGVLIRIDVPTFDQSDDFHESEIILDGYDNWDYRFINRKGSLDDLYQEVVNNILPLIRKAKTK